MDERLAKAADHWSKVKASEHRLQWWMHPTIIRHVNRVVCGQAIEGLSAGFHQLIKANMPESGFERGISVGCGVAAKEISLLTNNIVQKFDLFEISDSRLQASKRLARRHGVFERINFHCRNAFEIEFPEEFDIIYWNNSLHHMFDAHEAVSWSYRSLKIGGLFAMEDFVGPSRFQWSELELEVAERVRNFLPDRLMLDLKNPPQLLDRKISRPDLEKFIEADPSEAADSSNILDAVKHIFPNVQIIPTGGIVYGLALGSVMANFDDEEDAVLMQSLLLLDEVLTQCGHTQMAVALAKKRNWRGHAPSPPSTDGSGFQSRINTILPSRRD